MGKRKAELRIRVAFIRDLIKRSDLVPVRLRKGNKTPKGLKCAEAFVHFLTSLAKTNKLVEQVVYHTNPVSLGAVLADNRGRDWRGVKEGSGKAMLWEEEASIPQVTAWDSASVFSRAASEQSERSLLKFSLTSAPFQCIPHILVPFSKNNLWRTPRCNLTLEQFKKSLRG